MPETAASTFDRLVDEHQREVFRICRSILRDDHLGADASQDAFLRVWSRLRSGNLPAHLPAWLRKVALSAAIDLARRRSHRAETRTEEPARESAGCPSDDPARTAALQELEERLATAIGELPDGQRSVFLLRHEGGLGLREVAELLDVKLPTVKTQFARACLKLQARLAPYRPDPNRSEEPSS